MFSLWWIICLLAVVGTIVLFFVSFNSAPIDVRGLHSKILAQDIFDCVSYQEYLENDFMKDDFTLTKNCGINEELMKESGNLFFSIEVLNISDKKVLKTIKGGDTGLEQDCSVAKAVAKSENFPVCYTFESPLIYFKDLERIPVNVKITVASREGGERIPIISYENKN